MAILRKGVVGFRDLHFITLLLLFLQYVAVQGNLPPQFSPIPGTSPQKYYNMDKERYREDFTVGEVMYILIAEDPDGDPITFGITEGSDFFDVSEQNDTHAAVKLINVDGLDYETATSHDITWTLHDGVNDIVFDPIVIYITDVNDNPPVFHDEPYIEDHYENTTIGTTVLTVSATDADSGQNGQFDFSIDDDHNGMFSLETDSLDPEKAYLILNDSLDFETQRTYQVEITALDRGTDPEQHSTTTNAFINVLDVQDTPPFFLYLPYYSTVEENMPANTPVLDVMALDGDRGEPQPVKFNISADQNVPFWVETFPNGEGTIYTSEELDREEQELYTFILTAKEIDEHNQPIEDITTTTTVSVTVLDVNDEKPRFDNDSYTGTIQENSPNQVAVDNLEMIVTDLDLGDGGKFQLSIIGDEESEAAFYVTPTGTIINRAYALVRVRNSMYLDYERRTQFDFQVFAEETDSEEKFNNTADVTVCLTDMNDNSPVFHPENYNSTIDEHSDVGTFVVQLNATDADSGIFGEVTYSLTGGSRDLFNVDQKFGNVTVANAEDLDRETSPTYLVIGASGDGGGRTTTTEIVVTLLDINDNAPEFVQPIPAGFIAEGINYTDVVQVQATDADDGSNAEIVYSIIDVEPREDSFVINNATGWIGVTDALDFDTLPERYDGKYTLKVQAEDRGEPPLNDTTDVIINVEGVNDNAPYFLESEYVAHITEEYTGGNYVITVNAYDDDAPHNPYQYDSYVDYRIISGSNDKFSLAPTNGIHNNSYSNISIALGVVNMDVDLYGLLYNMTLRATDRGNPQRESDCTVIVHVKDVNNKPPRFDESYVIEMVKEDVDVGYHITTMKATDPDRDSVLFYEIIGIRAVNERGEDVTDSNFTTQFWINSTNGDVHVNESLNREYVEIFYLDILVKDTNATDYQNDSAVLEVRVEDVNDNAPTFLNTRTGLDGTEYYDGEIQEENPSVVYSDVKATDPDKGTNGDVIYKIVQNDTDHFKINEDTGDITLHYQIDREEIEQLNITVRAQDGGSPPRSTDILVYFKITDINDNAPEFVNLPEDIEVFENETVNSEIYTVSATDDDTGNFAVIEYDITAGNGEGKFDIHRTTGVVYIKESLDREETDQYSLTITATDNPGGSPQLTTSNFLHIKLLDVNDNAPKFDQDNYEADIREDETKGRLVISVTAIDPDLGFAGTVNYSIGDRNDTDLFEIVTVYVGNENDEKSPDNTGTVQVYASSLTNQQGRYFVELIAEDNGIPQLSSNASLMIDVLDVNDNAPVFKYIELNDRITRVPVSGNTTDAVHLTENYIGHVCRVYASDADLGQNGLVMYSIREIPGDPTESWKYFDIDAISGEINITHKTDRETIEMYSLVIVATDQGEPTQLSSELNLQVIIDDIDDNPPVYPRDEDGRPIPDILYPIEEQDYGDESIGKVSEADDADIGENAVNYYFIIAGNEKERFRLDSGTREMFLNDILDREETPQYELTIKADNDSNWDPSSYVFNPEYEIKDPRYWNDTTLQLVIIDVVDINDNPPVFTKNLYTAGVSTDTEYGSSVTKVEAIDADEDENAVVRYKIIKLDCRVDNDVTPAGCNVEDSSLWPFVIGDPLEGIIYTNIVFEPGWTGYFDLEILAADIGNLTDETILSIYLLRDDQRVKVIVLDESDNVIGWVDDFMAEISNITNAQCSDDSIKVHIDANGEPQSSMTDIFMHCVDPDTNEIMPVDDIIALLDRYEDNLSDLYSRYSVIAVVPAVSESTQLDYQTYLQISMGVLLFVLLFLLILLLCCYFSMRSKYQRKLRAATSGVAVTEDAKVTNNMMNLPGTNQHKYEGSNPLWNVEGIYSMPTDEDEKNSLDENEVEGDEGSEDQEIAVNFDDDYDNYTKLPPEYAEADDILSAAIGEHDKQKLGLDLGEMEVTAV
ncbi:cadherin-23-like [Ptychodera flava]|uniref:cadherin-23-like n=1 Tax=Ptychodera flava TaxID=63121 RepID=UPI003969D261